MFCLYFINFMLKYMYIFIFQSIGKKYGFKLQLK